MVPVRFHQTHCMCTLLCDMVASNGIHQNLVFSTYGTKQESSIRAIAYMHASVAPVAECSTETRRGKTVLLGKWVGSDFDSN